jgi:hypothetical protein
LVRASSLFPNSNISNAADLRSPRWMEAIRSSDANSRILNTVSKTTPITTNQNADLWTDVGYLSDSYTMPMPNSTAAAISAWSKTD